MPDSKIVNLEERARISISLGESHFREFKSALQGPPNAKTPRSAKKIRGDIGEALVAFANADGGELLVGVEDNGMITGIDLLGSKEAESLELAPQTQVHAKTPLPPIRTAKLLLDGKCILYFSVQKSSTHVHLTSDGRCVLRRDLETVPIPPEEILFNRRERESREYDREYVDGASAKDLNIDLVRIIADQLSPGMSVEKCLQYLDLAEYIGPGLRLRRAALLLFAAEPQRWHPRLQLRIIRVKGTELGTGVQYNATSDQTVSGNILELVEEGWEALRPQLVQTSLGSDARFGATAMYPELACREALINAIAHRDYSEEGRGIEIYVFEDRMEVRNPGGLLSTITVADLLKLEGVHQSRNANLARVLREHGYMRELGEGMRRMFDLMKVNELTFPEIFSDSNSFCVTLRHKTIYDNAQILWLEQFERLHLNREQKAIVVLGINGILISPQAIWDSLGIVDTEHYRQLLRSLQDLQILHSELPKKLAQRRARKRGLTVRNIDRFKISSPESDGAKRLPQRKAKVQKEDPEHLDSPDPQARIWIANLGKSIDEASLIKFLETFGEVQYIYLPKVYGTRDHKGYAFVEFATPAIAAQILPQINGHELQGRLLTARWALPKSK